MNTKEIGMGIGNMVKNAANRYLGRTGTAAGNGRAGGAGGRRGTPIPSGRAGGVLRKLLNRR